MTSRVFGREHRRAALALGLFVAIAGCGGSDPALPKLGKVKGKVTYKGQPVTTGQVAFTPVAGKGGETGQGATGEITPDGSFEMTTFNTGDGAILGEHVVTVVVREKPSPNAGQPDADGHIKYELPKSVTPAKYASVEKSPLRCAVTEGGMTFDIDLKD